MNKEKILASVERFYEDHKDHSPITGVFVALFIEEPTKGNPAFMEGSCSDAEIGQIMCGMRTTMSEPERLDMMWDGNHIELE